MLLTCHLVKITGNIKLPYFGAKKIMYKFKIHVLTGRNNFVFFLCTNKKEAMWKRCFQIWNRMNGIGNDFKGIKV